MYHNIKKGPFRVTLPKIVEACGAEPGAPPLTSAKESICQSHKYHYYRIVTARNIELYIHRLNLNYTRRRIFLHQAQSENFNVFGTNLKLFEIKSCGIIFLHDNGHAVVPLQKPLASNALLPSTCSQRRTTTIDMAGMDSMSCSG